MKAHLPIAMLWLLLPACADPTRVVYTPTTMAMDPNQARWVVEQTLQKAAANDITTGYGGAAAKVFGVRVRSDAFGIALQGGKLDWSLFNDVKYSPPGLKTCPFAVVNPAISDLGQWAIQRYMVKLPECDVNLHFMAAQYYEAKNFVDALYVLKLSPRR